jgi:hypothetical protein
MNPYRPTRTIRLVTAALAVLAVTGCSPDDTGAEALQERAPTPVVDVESSSSGATYDCQRVRAGSYC